MVLKPLQKIDNTPNPNPKYSLQHGANGNKGLLYALQTTHLLPYC